MANANVAERLKICLQQHIQWYEQMMRCYENVETAVDESLSEDFEQRIQSRNKELAMIGQELRLIADEWTQAQQVNTEDLAAVRALAEQAESLAQRVAEQCNRAAKQAQERLKSIAASLADLRKGRNALENYRAGHAGTAETLDKEA